MVEYTLRHNSRARRINITVRRDGTVWVTKSKRVSMREVDAFIRACEQWILRTRERFAKLPKTWKAQPSKIQYGKYKGTARRFVSRRIAHFNSLYRFQFADITIRNQRSRWGSCSHRGVLSFNYRIFFLPPALADYVIVHELCHLQEMNHSKRFWALIERTIPDHLERRKALRKIERGF